MKKMLVLVLLAIAFAPLAVFGQNEGLSEVRQQKSDVNSEQQLSINPGTFQGRNATLPIFGRKVGSGLTRTQFIIPKESIGEMQFGEITKLKYYSALIEDTLSFNWGDALFEVYLKEVNFTEYDSYEFYDWNNMDLVYTGSVEIIDGIMTVNLDNHFTYEGGNLMISFKQIALGNMGAITWYGIQTTHFGGLFGSGAETYLSNKLPQTTFVYIPHEAPSCIKPSEIVTDELNATNATLNWAEVEGQDSWQLVYSTDASFDPEQASLIEVPQRPYTLLGLEPETDYYVYLRANCGGGSYSEWSNVFAFSTIETCVTPTNLQMIDENGISAEISWAGQSDNHIVRYKDNAYNEGEVLLFCDFEDGIPSDWTVVDVDGDSYYWTHDATGYTSFEGNGCMYSLSYLHSTATYLSPDDWMITPAVELGGMVTFYAKGKKIGAGVAEEHFAVYVSTTDTDVESFVQVSQEFITTSDYALYSVDLSDYQGEVGYIAIRHFYHSHMFSLSVDNFTVYANPPVWTEIAGVLSSPYTLEGLSEHSFYEVQVKALCGDEESSRWSQSLFFNTTTNCDNVVVDVTHPFFEGFEGSSFPPTCWTADPNVNTSAWSHYIHSNSYQNNNHHGYHSGSSSVYSGYHGPIDLTMPEMRIVANAADLSFWSYNSTIIGTNGSNSVWISTDGGVNYTRIWNVSSFSNGSWVHTVLHLNSSYLNKNIVIMFRFEGDSGHSWYIDDIEVRALVDKEFVTAGNWDVASNWVPQGVPTLTQSVLISADATVPSGFVAQANSISIGVNGSLTIADGGQLVHNNAGVEAIVKKTVTGYGLGDNDWYLIATPIENGNDPANVVNLVSSNADDFDLYGFNQSEVHEEWQNYKNEAITYLDNAKGYLYANAETVDIEFEGELMPSQTPVAVALEFDPAPELSGWNLVGNPFACIAYLEDGGDFYRMNEDGSDLMLADGEIQPCEGVFVKATAAGQTATFTRTAPNREGCLNLSLRNRNGQTVNRARVHFNGNRNTEVFSIRPNSTKLFFSQEGKDFAAVGSETTGELPLNFKASENGTYTIGVNCDRKMSYMHLIDNLTGADVDLLKSSTYTFESKVTDYASRFKVVFVAETDDTDCIAIVANGQLVVLNPDQESILQLIDMIGRIVFTGNAVGGLSLENLGSGVYVLRQTKGSEVKTQKVVLY